MGQSDNRRGHGILRSPALRRTEHFPSGILSFGLQQSIDFYNFTSNISNVTGRALVPALLLGLYFSSAQDGGASQVGNFAMALLYMQELIAVIKYMVQGGKFYQSYQVSCDMMDQLLEMPKEQCGESVLRKVHTVELQNVTSPYATICFMAVKKRKNLRTNWAGMRCWILWRPRRMGRRPRSTARATT